MSFQQMSTRAFFKSNAESVVIFCVKYENCIKTAFYLQTEHYESREARQTSGTSPDWWKGTVY